MEDLKLAVTKQEPIPISIENMSVKELMIAFSLCGILSNPNNKLSMEANLDFAELLATRLIERLGKK